MPRPPRGAREAPDPPPRRNAFTKISEPAKIAVSCLTVPQGLCAVFNPGQKAPISYQTPLTSHAFAEVMFTPQITETVVYQCAEHHIQQQVRSLTQTLNTVYIGFYDQPPSQESGSLNPKVVAKLSGFSLGLATRWSLKPM